LDHPVQGVRRPRRSDAPCGMEECGRTAQMQTDNAQGTTPVLKAICWKSSNRTSRIARSGYRSRDAQERTYHGVNPLDATGFHLVVIGFRNPNDSH
jgi:hypothetical protein